MIRHNKPVPYDLLYVKVKGREKPLNVCLCEVLDGELDKETLAENSYKLIAGEGKKSVNDLHDKTSLLIRLNKELAPFIVEDFAVLPSGEMVSPELTTFLKKYDK